ncbi:MAG: serine/threonine-protein kinase [Desulfobacteraceae bacterium]
MAVHGKKASTISWIKEKTLSTCSAINKGVFKQFFSTVNKKSLVIALGAWILISIAGFVYFKSAENEAEGRFINQGVDTAVNFRDKISARLLENDILSLNVALGELEKKINPVFAAITDHHQNMVVHSNPDAINSKLTDMSIKEKIGIFNEVEVKKADYRENKNITVFHLDIFFSDVKIGSLLFGLSTKSVNKTIVSYKKRFWVLFSAAAAVALISLIINYKITARKIDKNLDALSNLDKVGPYFLKRKFAQGGMSELYLAEYIRGDGFKRTVVIKKILPHLAQNKDFLDMFIREARLAAMLQHPNIVQIYDLIEAFNTRFIAMEYIDGTTLYHIMDIEKKGLSIDLAIYIIQKISLGLYYSHTRKNDKTGDPLYIIHRDITPQNMLISYRGEVKISDFGISKAKSEPSLTQVGVIKGKLSYLSPEQTLGKQVDHQADIYALGIILYEILSGEKLYNFNNELEAMRTIPAMEIPDISLKRPDIPDALKAVVAKCLEKDKARRYQNAKDIHDDLIKLKQRLNIRYDETDLSNYMVHTIKPYLNRETT